MIKYDGQTGQSLGVFTVGGQLRFASDSLFGPDGHFYVSSYSNSRVMRYDGVTGQFLGAFAQNPALVGPVGIAFGPDSALYVASEGNSRILRFDGNTGDYLGVFAQGPTLIRPTNFTFTIVPESSPILAILAWVTAIASRSAREIGLSFQSRRFDFFASHGVGR